MTFFKKEIYNRNSLSTKIILMVEVILLISSILFCSVSVYRARVAIRKAIQQRMLDIANCAAGSVNGDILKDITKETIGSKEYKDVYNTLAVFRDNVELEYVYSIKEDGPGNFIFTMDLDQVTPASYGDSVKYTEALASAGRGTAAVDEIPYTDKWGEFYSAYSPVFDSSGKVAGIIAVDFSADWFESQLSQQMRSTVVSYIIILILSLLVAAFLSLITVRPFVRMQGELLEEKVRAEIANRAKSDFLANMSHEIRTPINAVLGMNEMILREGRRAQEHTKADSKEVSDALKNIRIYAADVENAGHNLLAIINDILDFSKIEAGRMDLVDVPYQFSSVLNDLSNMIHFKAKDKGLDFIIDVDRQLPDDLSGDEVRVRQILTNILNNAVKYTEKGSVSMTVRGERTDDDTIQLTVSVRDTGIGIRQEDVDKLFTKFVRLELERNSTVEGTGLGLVITKRLLDMMGGNITVESEYGKGSLFTVTIPQKIVSDVSLGDFKERFEATLSETGKYRESFRAPNARILVVDDTQMNLNVVINLLKNTQIQLDTATCGADAVEMAGKTSYDVILMDQRMPVMDGTEALKRIRSTENGASIKTPVICLTADAVIGAKERYIEAGFSDYLTKPIDSHAMEKMLMRFLPKEKVECVREENGADIPDIRPTDEFFETLEEMGVDTGIGLKYCSNDKDFYRSMLSEYVRGRAEKEEGLKKSIKTKDMREYAVYVHAIKSSSKMIGASLLSEQAAKLEAAADNSDIDTVLDEHDLMMDRYISLTESIRPLIPDDTETDQDSDILEFLPDAD